MNSVMKILSVPPLAVAALAGLDVQAQDRELDALKARVALLESDQRAGKGSSQRAWLERFEFAGLLEFEALAGENFDGDSYSDVVVATVELAIDASISRYVNASVSFLYEEDATDFGIDEAAITFSNQTENPLSLTLGQIYLPFGSFETAMVNDTLALELGETLQTAVLFAYEQKELSASFYLFDGDVEHPDTVETWGFSLAYTAESFSGGIDYISSLADSDGMAAIQVEDSAAGVSLHGRIAQDDWVMLFEYLAATSSMELVDTTEIELEVLHLEFNYNLIMSDKDVTLALALQNTSDAGGYLPEDRVSFGASMELLKATTLGVELWFDEDYKERKGGSGNGSNAFIVQIATVF